MAIVCVVEVCLGSSATRHRNVFCIQADESKVGILHLEMDRLLRRFMVKFVPLRFIRGQSDLRTVDSATRANQHPDDLIAVGMSTRAFMAEDIVTSAMTDKLVVYLTICLRRDTCTMFMFLPCFSVHKLMITFSSYNHFLVFSATWLTAIANITQFALIHYNCHISGRFVPSTQPLSRR